MKSAPQETNANGNGANDPWLEVVRRQVGSLRFGIVQVVVHDSRVVQIERTEKVRFANPVAVSIEAH